jgi:hypothetical protein
MRFDKIEIWDLMRSGIEHFNKSELVTNALRVFDDGQFADPLFHFCFDQKCGDELDLIALLNNWYAVTTPIGTLRENINYAQQRYDGGINDDPTLRKLSWTKWSRAAIEGGRTLFANGVPGVWINDSAIGALDSRIYVHGFRTIWLPIINKIRPPKIYLCGAWAKGIAKILRGELRYPAESQVEVKCHPIAWGKGGGWDQGDGPSNLGEE